MLPLIKEVLDYIEHSFLMEFSPENNDKNRILIVFCAGTFFICSTFAGFYKNLFYMNRLSGPGQVSFSWPDRDLHIVIINCIFFYKLTPSSTKKVQMLNEFLKMYPVQKQRIRIQPPQKTVSGSNRENSSFLHSTPELIYRFGQHILTSCILSKSVGLRPTFAIWFLSFNVGHLPGFRRHANFYTASFPGDEKVFVAQNHV